METSLDGKIMGRYIQTEVAGRAGDAFYRIAFGRKRFYPH